MSYLPDKDKIEPKDKPEPYLPPGVTSPEKGETIKIIQPPPPIPLDPDLDIRIKAAEITARMNQGYQYQVNINTFLYNVHKVEEYLRGNDK